MQFLQKLYLVTVNVIKFKLNKKYREYTKVQNFRFLAKREKRQVRQ